MEASGQVEVRMPTCNWCGRIIIPTENFVKLSCPSCGGALITRCQKCKTLGRPYRCPKCGFTGP